MGTPAAVAGDRITGICTGHLVPGPTGAPTPAPPLPFGAPVGQAIAASVLIQGRPAVVVGSAGVNSLSPHTGLHPGDPFMTPALQRGTVVAGSSTVLIEGRGAASTGARCQLCLGPVGVLQGSIQTVLMGGGPGG